MVQEIKKSSSSTAFLMHMGGRPVFPAFRVYDSFLSFTKAFIFISPAINLKRTVVYVHVVALCKLKNLPTRKKKCNPLFYSV